MSTTRLTRAPVSDVANAAISLGKGALLAKIDIKAAYRLVPVQPGKIMKWLNKSHLNDSSCGVLK